MDLTNNIEWKDGVSGGTPLTAGNLNRINKGTKTALEELESETQSKVTAAQDSITALQNGLENGNIIVNKSSNDAMGNNIESTYAKQDGTYQGMTVGKASQAVYASADTSKGTIEERLTNLGFKQGVVELDGALLEGGDWTPYVKKNYLKRQGNYVIGRFQTSSNPLLTRMLHIVDGDGIKIGVIPAEFEPKDGVTEVIMNIGVRGETGLGCYIKGLDLMLIATEIHGNTQTSADITVTMPLLDITFGYEAKKIKIG